MLFDVSIWLNSLTTVYVMLNRGEFEIRFVQFVQLTYFVAVQINPVYCFLDVHLCQFLQV